jgi:hypothetical protein
MSKVMVGGRAKIYVDDKLIGIFESCTVANTLSTEPIHILGRFTPAEIAILSKEAVNVSCSGFRVVGAGKHTLPKMPKVQDLLSFTPFKIDVIDRQTGETIESVFNCVPTTDNSNYNAKATSRVAINYVGTIASDESGAQDEGAGSNLP